MDAIGLNLASEDVFKIERIRSRIESFEDVQQANVFFPIKLEYPQEWIINAIDRKLQKDTATGKLTQINVSKRL